MKFLFFLYAVSVIIFFAIFVSLNYEAIELYKKYDITMPKQGIFRKVSGWTFIMLVSMVPGLRIVWILLVLISYATKEEEFKTQNGGAV